jgi:hypothetical protein
MYKKLVILISVLVLSSVSTSYALVVGDFEGGLDGWVPAGDATLTLSATGATTGTGSLMIEGPGSWQMLAKLDIKSIRSVLGVDGAAISADVTAFAEDMQTDWMNMEMIINGQNNDDNGANNNIGWQSLGALDIVRDGTTHTLTWELPADLSAKIAGTDDSIAWFELFIVTNNGATNTKIYVDNIQLIGAEPEPEPEEPGTKIIYVDATDGETGNTTLATGEIFTATGGNDGTDGLWRPRAFGNSATIFEANGATNGNPNDEIVPRLNTTIQVPENDYDVYVYFWSDSSGWRIKAALENADPLPLFIANDPNGGATVAVAEDFEEPVPMLSEGNRTLWQAYLGTTGVTTSISVYIDSDPRPAGVTSWNERTWYDGIGYKIASETKPEPEEVVPVYPGTEGLVAHYAFENDVNDSSGNALNGTVIGDANFVEGVEGMALDLNGQTYVDCGGVTEFSFIDAMTVSTWVNIRSVTTAWMTIAAKGENAWRLSVNNTATGIQYAFSGGTRGWQAANSATELAFDEWYHVAATYDTTVGATVYINGVPDASNPDTGGIDTNQFPLLIGENPEAVGRLFDGMLDELMIYNRALSAGEIRYLAGFRSYTYDGGALDDTWSHDNDSDAWDGTGPGEGSPGGVAALVEDGVTFLRIQDTGDPRDYGFSDPSNRKIYLAHQVDMGLDGAHMEFRLRVATTPPLDDMYPDGGAGIAPWPQGGIGYHIRDGGKGMIGLSEGGGSDNPKQISFSLAKAGEPGFENLTTDVLVMNGLGGTEANEDAVDTGDAGSIRNVLAIDDATAWNTVVVDIAPGGAGTHIVTVSVNGGPAVSFDVTAGNRCDENGNYIAIGSSGTSGITAFDVDYIKVSN